MINPFTEINWRPDSDDIKGFGRSVFTGFLCVAFLLFIYNAVRYHSFGILPLCLVSFGFVLLVVSHAAPVVIMPFYYIWYFVATCIGIIISNIFLIFFFYCILTPFAVVARIMTGRDPLNLKKTNSAASYWHEYRQEASLKRYFKQY